MGSAALTPLTNTLLVVAAVLAAFAESIFGGFRNIFGAQPDLLPVLMVFAGLRANFFMILGLAAAGGLAFDSLSANPTGVSIFPLLVIGLVLYHHRNLLMQEQWSAQFFMGAAASAFSPFFTLLVLQSMGTSPLVGWDSLWHWAIMTLGGAVATPICFLVFDWIQHSLNYQPLAPNTFRQDREIIRGRI